MCSRFRRPYLPVLIVLATLSSRGMLRSAMAVPTPDQIEAWIHDLDSDKFQKREQASRRLQGAGLAALDCVTQAAANESREVCDSAFEILQKWWQSSDPAIKEQARLSLEKLSNSDSASTARRASEVLRPTVEPAVPLLPGRMGFRFRPGMRGGGQRFPFGQMRIGGANPIQAQVIRVQAQNGKRTVDATENGKRIQIQEDPQSGIEVTVTEKADGKDKVSKFPAKNPEELNKNHPEAAKLYRKYLGPAPGGPNPPAAEQLPQKP